MGISNRLKLIAQQVSCGYVAADIGTDHGYVPIYLLKNNICPKVFAMDMSEGSLLKARENAKRFGYEEQMICRISDGFEKLKPGEADCAIISGMGGILMTKILENGIDCVRSLKEIIVSPHRDTDLVRDFLKNNGFEIVTDVEITDKKKTYPLIKAVRLTF